MTFNISITNFEERFNREYDFLYDAYDRVAGFKEAVEAFDRMIKTNDSFRRLVSEFAAYRSDLISSDREAAAFMFALTNMTDDADMVLPMAS